MSREHDGRAQADCLRCTSAYHGVQFYPLIGTVTLLMTMFHRIFCLFQKMRA